MASAACGCRGSPRWRGRNGSAKVAGQHEEDDEDGQGQEVEPLVFVEGRRHGALGLTARCPVSHPSSARST